MANFGAADVKRLRELTGAGMLDCKNALTDANGDFDKAVELLRVKGAKDVGKRASRTAANGLVAAVDGAMLRLNCETDFVAKNEQFQRLGADIVALVAGSDPASLAELLDATLADGRTVRATVDASAATLGEKLEVAEYAKFDGSVATYLHRRDPGLPPQVGVLVEFTGADAEAARGVAMQVAAMRPRFTRREDVPADVVDSERRIAEAATKEEGKPERAVPKIVEGRVNAFFRDTVLLEQQSVTDSKKTVADVVNAAGISVERFARFAIGEG